MPKNKIKHGLSNVHIAFIKDITPGENGVDIITYDDPIPVRGAVSLTTEPEGDEFKFYADNIVYYSRTSNNGYSADMEFALIGKEVKAKMYGWIIDDNGVLVEVSDAKPTPFALMGQYEGDVEGGRFVYYNVQATRGGSEYNTDEEGDNVTTETLSAVINPIKVEVGDDQKFIVQSTMDKSDSPETYNNFFKEVYMPGTVSEEV